MSDESLSRLQRLHAALTTQHLPCDIWLILAVVALAGLGWIMVSSASIGLLENSYHYSRQHGIFSRAGHYGLPIHAVRAAGAMASERGAHPARQYFSCSWWY